MTPIRPENREIEGFEVITPDGIIFTFEEADPTRSWTTNLNGLPIGGEHGVKAEDFTGYESDLLGSILGASSIYMEDPSGCVANENHSVRVSPSFNSSRCLTKIKLFNNEEIIFEYRTEHVHDFDYSGESIRWNNPSYVEDPDEYDYAWLTNASSGSLISVKRIEQITWPLVHKYYRPHMFCFSESVSHQYAYIEATFINQSVVQIRPEYVIDYYPLPIAPNFDWRRGVLKEVVTYKYDGHKIKRKVYSYLTKEYDIFPNVQVEIVKKDIFGILGASANSCYTGRHSFNYIKNCNISPWIVMYAQNVYDFNSQNENEFIHQKIEYVHGGKWHMNPTKITEDTSNYKKIVTDQKYSSDFDSHNGSQGIQALKFKNVNLPIEVSKFMITNNSEQLIESNLTTYERINNIPMPLSIYAVYNRGI